MIPPEQFKTLLASSFVPAYNAERDMQGLMPSDMNIPAGPWELDDTIKFGSATGLRLRGAGISPDNRFLNHFGRFSFLLAPSGKPAIEYHGSVCGKLEDLTLLGRKVYQQGPRSPYLVKYEWMDGYGATNNRLTDVQLCDAEVGILVGDPGDLMCDFIIADHVLFDKCDIGFRMQNGQSLLHSFRDCGANNCGTIWDVQQGGCITVDGGGCGECEYIAVFGDGGNNVAASTISNFRTEGKAKFKVGPYRTLDINQITMGASGGPSPIEFGVEADASLVHFSGGLLQGLKPGCIKVSRGGRVVFRNVTMFGFNQACIKSGPEGGGGSVQLVDCYERWGPDFKTYRNYTYTVR